jgi:hypothetical protein
MKRKEVADVMGGKEEWENADQMAGEYCLLLVDERWMRWRI